MSEVLIAGFITPLVGTRKQFFSKSSLYSPYLTHVESRSQFTDVSKFFGSKYYFDQLGLDGAALLSDIDRQSRDPSQNSRMLGDAFAESQLIIKQLRTLTNDSLLLSKNITNTDEQIKELLDNSIAEITRLGLNATDIATKGLTKDQANSLTKDIVTFETTKVNGISVLAPKIYLSLATRNRLLGDEGALAKNSVIFAKEDLTINSPTATLTNNGTISSGGNLILNVANFNSAPQIAASPTLVSPTATALRSSKFASLGGAQNATQNSATSTTPAYQTDYNTNAAIKSGGNLSIVASDIITLKNTTLNSGGLISLSAAKDITLANNQDFSLAQSSLNQLLAKSLPVAETNAGSPTFSISSSSIKDEAASARSLAIFNAASDIEIISGGSIKVANNYSNTSGSIFMTAAGDITNTNYTIKASDNVVMNATNIKNSYDAKRHSSNYGSPINDWTNEAKIESGGNITLNATGDISLQNSILDSKNKISLNGADINIFNDPIKSVITAATSTKSDILFTTSSIKDDAESTRSAITFNAISDIELNSTGSINIANNYLNTSGSIFMTAASDINNSNYTIKASENVVMNATNINNIHADSGYSSKAGATTNETRIEAGSIVSLNATNDITNIGATIKAGDLLYLTAGNNITNAALVNYKINGSSTNADGSAITEAQALASNANNIRSTLVSQGTLESGGNLVLVAGNDINNKGSNITATGAAYLEATNGDISITTTALRDRTVTSWGSSKKGGTNTKDSTTNIQSNITSGGNLDLASIAGDINITGSKINADGNLTLSAADDVNIAAAQDTSFTESTYHKKGMTVSKNSMSVKQTLTNVKSELDASGDISITSGADTNLIGVKLTAENAAINAGKELNVFSVADQSYSYASASKSRNFSAITKYALPGLSLVSKFYDAVPIPVLSNIAQFENSLANGDFSSKSNLLEKNKITNQASGLDVIGNLTLTANNNLNIKGSNLSGGGDASLTSTVGDVNIYNVADLDYSRSESHSSRTTWSSVGAGIIQTAAAGTSGLVSYFNPVKTPDQKINDLQENNEASKSIPQKTNTNININSNETIIASNLNFTNLNINSNKNTNVTSSNLAATDSATITSGDSTNILTAVENDYSYTFNEKKTPSIAAALSNSVVKIVNSAMPSFGHSKSDNTDSNNQIKELVYDTDKFKIETTNKTNIASNLSAALGDISITSNGNNLISGSNLSGGRNINLTSTTGSTTITSAADQKSISTEDVNQEYNKISGNYNRGRVSVDSESSVAEEKTTTTTTTQKQSTISAANNINITSNKDLNILSSDLTAGTNPSTSDTATSGTINLTSREGNVNVLALADTISTSSETKTGTLTLSAGVGNTVVDTAYAEYDVIQAAKAVADAKKNLNHMETLQNNGQATNDAAEDAKINLAISVANLALAELKLAASAAKVAGSAASLGFYADLKLSIDGSKTNTNSNSSVSVASNINSNGNLIISSGMSLLNSNSDLIAGTVGNTTITGSNISSESGDINIASKNNTVINASKDTYNSSTKSNSWSENITLGSTVAGGTALDAMIKAAQISLGLAMSKSKSDTASTTYNNSQLTASNGSINITSNGTTSTPDGSQSGGDTTIKGANILGQDVTITSNGNLSVESLQNSYTDKSKSFGLNLGGGGGSGSGSVSAGINYSSNKTDRLWTDNQTSILGTNSVTINTANNTNIKGAVIANITNTDDLNNGNGVIGYNMNSTTLADAIDGGNLTLNTKSLTFQNLQDHHTTENFGAGFSSSIGTGLSSNTNNGANPNPMQNLNFYPSGSTTLSLQNGSTKKEGTTFATLGNGTINLNGTTLTTADIATNPELASLNRDITKSQIITKDQITGALDVSVTIDNRLLVAAYEGLTGEKDKIQNDPTLTDKEKETKIAALQSSVLRSEQKNIVNNVFESNKALANLPIEVKNEINEAVIKVYDNINPAETTTPEVRENLRAIIRTAAITGETKTLKEQIKALTNKTPSDNDIEAITNLSKNRDFAELRDELGVISYNRFLDKYTLSTGVFFDGTGNDVNSKNQDYSEPTNVARMRDIYGSESRKYVSGVGTSGGLDTACLGLGCGADSKQREAIDYLNTVVNNGKNNEFLFFPIDVVSFSRGATTGSDFINNINNETYWSQGFLTRAHLMFDPVGSYGLPGNQVDIGWNFSTPTNIVAIQINAKDEKRNLFDLQSLSSKDGTLAGKHWTEITLPGVHADIGGGYKEGEQGKSQDIALYSMQTMINEAKNYGINFNQTPQNQLPSFELSTAMSLYRAAQTNYSKNKTEENKFYLEDVNKFILKNFAHDSAFGGSGKIYNYSLGNDRGVFYPNSKYFTESGTLKTGDN